MRGARCGWALAHTPGASKEQVFIAVDLVEGTAEARQHEAGTWKSGLLEGPESRGGCADYTRLCQGEVLSPLNHRGKSEHHQMPQVRVRDSEKQVSRDPQGHRCAKRTERHRGPPSCWWSSALAHLLCGTGLGRCCSFAAPCCSLRERLPPRLGIQVDLGPWVQSVKPTSPHLSELEEEPEVLGLWSWASSVSFTTVHLVWQPGLPCPLQRALAQDTAGRKETVEAAGCASPACLRRPLHTQPGSWSLAPRFHHSFHLGRHKSLPTASAVQKCMSLHCPAPGCCRL